MRFLVKATIPVETGNALVRDPKFSERMREVLEDIKPEAAYFTVDGGQRTLYLVVDLADASRIPAVAEPLWLSWEASVEFIPAMSEKDFAKAAQHIERAAKKY
jgi:uncharacterized protein DUF3303